MPKNRTDPSKSSDGTESHPAFGMISLHQIHAQPGEVLFQSDVRHSEYITIEVHEATRKRDLTHDWVHPTVRVCEVSLSMSQFASFVASGGYQGVPCTIEYTGNGRHGRVAGTAGGQRPGLKPAPRLSLTLDEVRASAAKTYAHVQEALTKYQEALTLSGAGSAAAKKNALRTLEAAIKNAAANVAYSAKCLDEHAEAVVEKSRADIEAMVVKTAERLGVSPESVQLLAIEAGSDE